MNRRPRYFLGVDGGQTSTLTVLVNQDGEILASALSGPCNHIHEPGGLERQYRALREGYEQVMAAAGVTDELACAYLGLTGSGSLEVATSVYRAARLVLKSDTVTALAGAIPEMVGVIVISGTGSVAYGRNASGAEALAGGMGYFAGDEGSGYEIAQRGIQAIYQAADGRGPQTLLTDLILAGFECQTLRELHYKIYSGALSRDQLARAASMVGRAASRGDTVAIRILANAGNELGRAVAAVLTRLEMTATPVPVAPIGGVFKSGHLVTDPLLARVHQTNPQAYLTPPRFIPAIGAAILALREGGIMIDEHILAALERTRERLAVGASGEKFTLEKD
ncbi:MAG: hypothetical protein HPY64_02105 [Anaerolineae bacterium]|nr:hypothetical protein [Anaerolineae bacterium]